MILGWQGRWLEFVESPEAVFRLEQAQELPRVLSHIASASLDGAWVGGYLRYDTLRSGQPLLYAHSYRSPPVDVTDQPAPENAPWLTPPIPSWDQETYAEAFAKVQAALRRGDSYQINLTFPLTTRLVSLQGTPSREELRALWLAVGSQGKHRHGGFLFDGETAVLGWSPELWVKAQPLEEGVWSFESRPMKGTAPRGASSETDKAYAETLKKSDKTRAENLMITDMVRHELSALVWPGRVETPRLFTLEALPTLWQMTSTVTAEGRFKNHPLPRLVEELFPAASITGAPKKRTRELIDGIEAWKRGVYCGALFLLAPGGSMEAGVAIRTMEVDVRTGVSVFGVGGGIVADSTAEDEYREALSKSAFLRSRTADFELIETMVWEKGRGTPLWNDHVERLLGAARLLGRACSPDQLRERVEEAAFSRAETKLRIRLRLDAAAGVRVDVEPFQPLPLPIVLLPAKEAMSGDPLLRRLKTSRREVYARHAPHAAGCEAVLWDEEGYVLEGTFTNLAFRLKGSWVTPSSRRVLLSGVQRAALLREGKIVEGHVTLSEAKEASEAACFNALRGWMPAVWAPS